MASLQEIKSRITSIGTTKKITQAMKLVASAKLKKAKKNLESIEEYCSSVEEIFKDVKSRIETKKDIKKNDKTLYILITSDIGLCGGYNNNVINLLKENLNKDDQIIVIGNKGISSLKSQQIDVKSNFANVGDKINYLYASLAAEEALSIFETNGVSQIKLIYTEFVNSITFMPRNKTLLPIEDDKDKVKKISLTEFEPSVEVILKNIIPLYISSSIFRALVESKVSETSSRRMAMDNSTENAKELIETLNLKYNRARQSAITQEITEIVAGSDSK